MLLLPIVDVHVGEKEVRVLGALLREVEHHRRRDEVLRNDGLERVVLEVLARHPMHRRIEMRAGMLADGEVVPVPGDAALIVMRNLFHPERRALAERRRQDQRRRVRRKGLREIDGADAAGGNGFRERLKRGLRHRVLGGFRRGECGVRPSKKQRNQWRM